MNLRTGTVGEQVAREAPVSPRADLGKLQLVNMIDPSSNIYDALQSSSQWSDRLTRKGKER
jgi:hypothetical protein